MDFEKQLSDDIARIEQALEAYLSGENGEGYDVIFKAAKYSAMAGGKRLRPVILLAFCRMCGGETENALPFACALEMIHTYSLIHDDLPCMDNDDLRRGRPTSHKVFGEATALLAGDALLTRAFEISSANAEKLPAETVLRAIGYMAQAAGMTGMIGGQVLDMESEHKQIDLETLQRLQRLKTGRLIRIAAVVGCLAAGKDDADTLRAAETYGDKLGLAFQIQDDILDVEGDAATLGKSVGKDEKSEKSTFPSLLGMEECKRLVTALSGEAIDAISTFPDSAFLGKLTGSLIGRVK